MKAIFSSKSLVCPKLGIFKPYLYEVNSHPGTTLSFFTRLAVAGFILTFVLCANETLAQASDTLVHQYDSLAKSKVSKLDSADRAINSMKQGLTAKIDSLQRLSLPTDRYTRKLDSLNKVDPQKYIDEVNSKIGNATSKISQVENKIDQPIDNIENRVSRPIDNLENKVNSKFDSFRQEGGNVPSLDTKTDLKLNADIDKLEPDIDRLTPDIDKIDPGIDKPNINTDLNAGIKDPVAGDLPRVPNTGDLTGKVSDLDVKGKIGDAQSKIGEMKDLPNTIENKASQLDEVKDLQKQTGEIDKAKGMLDKAKDPSALKTQAKQQITRQAVDHFRGKEQVLQQAMDKVGKLKAKYSDVKSIKDLPKRPPNPMKGKPVIERIIPGVTLQIQKNDHLMIDVNPVVSYRFTGRINAGLGWNERFVFTRWNRFSGYDRIFGPRMFGSFGFKKGFALKAEIEKMNALVPSGVAGPDGSRQWVWSVFVGLKKDFKFMGRVKGNVQLLYNVYDDHSNSPYFDRLNVRMGFEFPMKKKKRPENQEVR